MRRTLLLTLALLLALPALAAAQEGRFEITPTAGYRLSGQVTAYDDDGFSEDTDLEVDEGAIYGLTFDIPLGYRWQLELLANRQQSSFSFDPGLFDPSVDLGDVDIDYYHVGLLYEWGRGQVNPYGTAAIGLARIQPDSPAIDAEDQFSASLAGGVKLRFNENLGLRLEVRGYWTNLDTDFDAGRRRRHFDTTDEALYQVEGSAGLILAF